MAVRKPRPAPTPDERLLADRIAAARRATPPRDPAGHWHEQLAELARRTGADLADLLDEWDERSAVREYLGATDRDEAERAAYLEVEARTDRQGRLL